MLEYFEGPAGSGKTFKLLKAVESHLAQVQLEAGQRVLGLSFMHGARRRLDKKLGESAAVGGQFICSTIDSFARSLASRWRSLAATSSNLTQYREDQFRQTLREAAYILSERHVRRWVGWSFPVILIDEFQDCSSDQIEFIAGMEPGTRILAAADGFQHLNEGEDNAAIQYLRKAGGCILLSGNHRTSVPGLLETARLARAGQPAAAAFLSRGKGIWMQPVRKHFQAAVAAARNIVWYGGDHCAILSPVGPNKAPFFLNTVERLRSENLIIDRKKVTAAGPFRIRWISTLRAKLLQELESVGLTDDAEPSSFLSISQLRGLEPGPGQRLLLRHLQRQRRLTGNDGISRNRARRFLEEALSQLAAHSQVRETGIEAMTIHQAKNQEFDSVIVLWPVQTGGSLSYQRRLLYNAVTRAKRHACVLIQDPQGDRLKRDLERELFGLGYR